MSLHSIHSRLCYPRTASRQRKRSGDIRRPKAAQSTLRNISRCARPPISKVFPLQGDWPLCPEMPQSTLLGLVPRWWMNTRLCELHLTHALLPGWSIHRTYQLFMPSVPSSLAFWVSKRLIRTQLWLPVTRSNPWLYSARFC